MLSQILNLTWKELLQLARDRFLVLFLILAPTLQLVLLANNTASGILNISTAVLDLDQSALSRELVTGLANSEEMAVRFFPSDRAELLALLDAGEAQVGIVIPAGFSRAFFAGDPDPAQLQALVDGSNIIIGANARQVIQSVADQLLFRRLRHTTLPEIGGVEVRTAALFNPAFDFQWFGIPSMVAFITYQVALVVAATGFVREKELGTLEQLLITPLRRLELIIGKALPAILVGVFNFLLLLAVQSLGFGVPLRGDLGMLVGVALLFAVAIVGQGTLISILTHTQQQAVLLVFLVAILEVTISGYLLPVESMPLLMRGLAEISALQHFMAIMRAVALRGADFAMIQTHVFAILAFAIVAGAIAWRAFTRSL